MGKSFPERGFGSVRAAGSDQAGMVPGCPSTLGESCQGGAAGLLPNPSLRGSDASLVHGSLSAAAVERCGKNFSRLPVTCSDAKPKLGKHYPWLSPQPGDTWGTCVLFFLKLKELEHG